MPVPAAMSGPAKPPRKWQLLPKPHTPRDRRSPIAAVRETGGRGEVQFRPDQLAPCLEVLSQEKLMPNTLCTLEQSTFYPSSILEVKREQQRASLRRSSRITLGFWLGGIHFGTAGCVLGRCLTITPSLGSSACFGGASIGDVWEPASAPCPACSWSEVPLVTPELGRPRESPRPWRRTMASPALSRPQTTP
jgi:hypothetical protein